MYDKRRENIKNEYNFAENFKMQDDEKDDESSNKYTEFE